MPWYGTLVQEVADVPFRTVLTIITLLSSFLLPLPSHAQELSDAMPDLAEFRIGVTDDGLAAPDDLLVGYAELDLGDRVRAPLDADRAQEATSKWIFALHLVRVSETDQLPGVLDSPLAEQTIIDANGLIIEPATIRPDVLISVEQTGGDDVALDLVRIPETVTYGDIAADIQTDNRAFAWLNDNPFRPGLPVTQPNGDPAQAVVAIPFTFPLRSTYILFSPDTTSLLALFQAVAISVGPGCDPDFALSSVTGECEPRSGNVAATAGPSTDGADVIALISSSSITLNGRLELGRETWAIVNTTPDARAFSIFRVLGGVNVDQSVQCVPPGVAETLTLAELSMEQINGLTPFSGSDPRKLSVKLGPGSYAIVATMTLSDGTIDAHGCFFDLQA